MLTASAPSRSTIRIPTLAIAGGFAIALRFGTPETAAMAYLVIAVYALRGPAQSITALALSWLFTMLNPGLAPQPEMLTIMRYAVLFAAAASVGLRAARMSGTVSQGGLMRTTAALGVFMILHSFVISPIPPVSFLKAVSWILAITTVIAGWGMLSAFERERLSRRLFAFLVAIMLVSLPLLVLPVGYLRNGTGFQGILNQPQAFGPTIALLGALTGARLLALPKPRFRLLCLFAVCVALILASESRTAGLAMLIGILVGFIVASLIAGQRMTRLVPSLMSLRTWMLAGLVVVAALMHIDVLAAIVDQYISKSGRADVHGLLAAYDGSRGRLIEQMVANINQSPWTGIGFGIASQPETMLVKRDPFLGLPIGASVEKGVTPVAVLEELGAIGAALVALWSLLLLRQAAGGGLESLAVFVTIVVLNLGEATLFSPGGMGLLPIILLGWAATRKPVLERSR